MNFETLKEEAKKLGYRLVKINPMPKKEPCICRSSKRFIEFWYGFNDEATNKLFIFCKCKACGRVGTYGKTKREAIENWNRGMLMLKEEK